MKCKDTLTLSLFADEPVVEAAPAVTADQPPSIDDLVAGEICRRDEICKEWRWCRWGAACMSENNDQEAFAYCENPRKAPLSALSRDELKVIAAGFPLVKYFREEKIIRVSEAELANGWCELPPFATYAQAERKLKALKAEGHIESNLDGTIVMSGWNQPSGLKQAGFEFYRMYGHETYHTSQCIKLGSKNWSNWQKFTDREETLQAWYQLMQDPKALEG